MFEIILFGLVVLCGLIILLCKYILKSKETGVLFVSEQENEPWYLDYARSFFPVLLIVFVLRGFIAEPFRIPSGSMLPTLEVGDFILVNKFNYGIRLPVLHNKVISVSNPKRGDIMVFRHPGDEINYIKRVIGLPGDEIEYRYQRLFVNGKEVESIDDGSYTPFPMRGGQPRAIKRYKQTVTRDNIIRDNKESEQVDYSILLEVRSSSRQTKVIVPEGHYFVLGDNRDHSSDSRYWGFVPDENIVGRAFFIWFHWNSNPGGGLKLSRIGEGI